ncbi:MAG: dihydroorotate dehydrogenase electron transfer subunit [Planctomycetaceae bacterium]|nr:dihydroorotate dehydrogenase electron transfer subunit [Planctomycetaceae bacterium]
MLTREPLLHSATVTRQIDYGHGYYVLEFDCPDLAASIGVGQFVNLRVRNDYSPLLRRPFSVFDVLIDRANNPSGISLLYHIVGAGTGLMAKMKEGEKVSLNGPLGKPFPWPTDDKAAIYMVGGGIGTAPFLLQAKRWMKEAPGREYVFIAGGRSDHDLKYMTHFSPLTKQGLNLMLTTEDGSVGFRGRVTDPLRGELQARAKKKLTSAVYCCGPTPMMAAVSALCEEFDVTCMASLESVMACGYGVCNGCVCAIDDATKEKGWRYAKTCIEGTCFDARKIQWKKISV